MVLEHLKIKTRLTIEKFASVKGECKSEQKALLCLFKKLKKQPRTRIQKMAAVRFFTSLIVLGVLIRTAPCSEPDAGQIDFSGENSIVRGCVLPLANPENARSLSADTRATAWCDSALWADDRCYHPGELPAQDY